MLSNRIKKAAFSSLLSLIVLLVVARLSAPYAIQSQFSSWFAEQGIDARITDVSLDLTDGRFTLTGIHGEKDGRAVFSLDSLTINWLWRPLFDHRAIIDSIRLNGLSLDVKRRPDSTLVVAGMQPASDEPPAASDADAKPDDAPEPVEWSAILNQLVISDFNLCFDDATNAKLNYCARFKQLAWDGELRFELAELSQADVPLYTQGGFSLQALTLHNTTLDRDLLSLNNFTLDTVSIDTLASIAIDRIRLDQLALLQRQSDDLAPQIDTINAITLTGLTLNAMNRLHIDNINIKDNQTLLMMTRQSTFELSEWLPETKAAPETRTDTAPTEDTTPFIYSIGSFRYTSDRPLKYVDASLSTPFVVVISSLAISIDDIDSSEPDKNSRLKLDAIYAEHGKITLQGTATPLAKKPSFDIDANLSGIDLRSVSAFTRETIGHSIKSGQLDAKLTFKADHSVLDSSVDLELHQFELKALSKKDAEKLDSSFGFPLNTSLSLLKDRDNSIRLSIPITGDLENPDFDPSDAITTATSKAITVAVINYYTPFGLVMAADSLFSLATALRFDPVVFEAGSSQLDPDAKSGIDKIANLMIDRPGIHTTLCGYANADDRAVLLPDSKADKNGQLPSLTEQQTRRLTQLANARSDRVKQTLVDAGINASRLILCTPEYLEEGELSGVEISI